MIKKNLLRSFVVCACAGVLIAGVPGELLAKPSNSDYQEIIECPVEFASGKGSIKVFQDAEKNADVIYYLPTRFELAQEKDKDSNLTLPSLSLCLTQRKTSKNEIEEFGDFKCSFNMNIGEAVIEKLKKELKSIAGLETAKSNFEPMPVKKATAILYTGNGKRIVELPATVIGTPGALQLVVAGRLDGLQSLLVKNEPVTVILQIEYQGKIKPLPYQLTYDNEAVLKLLKTPKNCQALLGLLLAADKKAMGTFENVFIQSKAIVWKDMSSDPVVVKRNEKLAEGSNKIAAIKELDAQASTRMVAMTLFDRLSSQISINMPESLPAEKIKGIETSIEQVFSDFAELHTSENNYALGKIEIPAMSVSSVDAIWAGVGAFNIKTLAEEIQNKVVTRFVPEVDPKCSFYMPALGNDSSLCLKEVVIEVTAMDERKKKITEPLTATYDFANDRWEDKDGEECSVLTLDLKKHYDKTKGKLGEGFIQVNSRVTQEILGKELKCEFKDSQPLTLGESPISRPLAFMDNLEVSFEMLTFGEDLKEVKIELNLASAKKKIELSVNADTKQLALNMLVSKVFSDDKSDFKSEKVDAEIQFITKTGKISKKVEDLLVEQGGSLMLFDDMWQNPE